MNSLLALALLLAQPPAPEHYTATTSHDVWDVAAEDLNGDGIHDLLFATCDGKADPPDKHIEVLLAAEGGYPSKISTTLTVPAHIGAFFLAEVNNAAPRELIAAHAEGATVYSWRGGRFEAIGKQEFICLLPTRAREPLFLKDAAIDLDGDGVDEWLLPVPSGYTIRNARGSISQITCDVVSEIRRTESTYVYTRLPAYLPFEMPGEGTKGLAFLSDEYADFAYGADWKQQRRFKVPLSLEEKWEASAKMADINNDGFPDLMVTQTKGTVNLQSVTQVYVASAPFEYPSEPTATFDVKGAVTSPGLVDVNGDKTRDAVVISIPFGAKNLISYFVRGKISVSADVYLYRDGGFGSAPAYRSNLTLEAPDGREQVAYALEDFDGDGVMDLAFSESKDALSFHKGGGSEFVANKAWVSVEMPSFGVARALNLNQTKAKDVVLFHPGGDNQSRVDVVLFGGEPMPEEVE